MEAVEYLLVVSYVLKSDDIIANFDVRHSGTDALNNTSSFMAEYNGKSAFRIFPTESIGICVAKAIVVNANSHLVGSGRSDLDFLNAQVLASGPRNGGFAGDGLAAGLGRIVHCSVATVCTFFRSNNFKSIVLNRSKWNRYLLFLGKVFLFRHRMADRSLGLCLNRLLPSFPPPPTSRWSDGSDIPVRGINREVYAGGK
jgi:hypothetical protein